jgi:small Trp-rich protein
MRVVYKRVTTTPWLTAGGIVTRQEGMCMWFVAIGVVMLVMNLAGIGPVGAWVWGWGERGLLILLPFGLAIVWWLWADMTGLTQRRAMARHEAKRQDRRERNAQALGLKLPGKRRSR